MHMYDMWLLLDCCYTLGKIFFQMKLYRSSPLPTPGLGRRVEDNGVALECAGKIRTNVSY